MPRTRQALKSLQYSSKGQEIAGLPSKGIQSVKDKGSSTPIVRKSQQKRVKEENTSDDKENPSKKISLQTFNTIGIQCSKLDEDMMCSGEVDSSEYWKIMAFKRRAALDNVNKENKELHEMIETLNHENEALREENKDLLELLDEANDIKAIVSEKPEGDSGFGGVDDSTQ